MSYQLPDYSEAKKNMVAERYRPEQDLTRGIAAKKCVELGITNRAVELYSGLGGETRIYKPIFKEVITNDLNKEAPSMYHMDAEKFVREVVVDLDKIDLIDFDAYGCPSEAIKLFFSLRGGKDAPIVVTVSDGLGVWMKRKRDPERIRQRYLLGKTAFDERHPWREHMSFLTIMMGMIAQMYNMRMFELANVQAGNYVLGTWLFEPRR